MQNQRDRDSEASQDSGQENVEDEASIISDQDESRAKSNVIKDDGFAGPASGSLEATEFSDEFLAGEIDVRDQMDKATDAIQDALESEIEDGPSPESD